VDYVELVGLYEQLAETDSTNARRSVLASAFENAGDQLHRLVLLVRGRLYTAYDPEELGILLSLMLGALQKATGVGEDALRERWSETGDLGDVAAWAVDTGGQSRH